MERSPVGPDRPALACISEGDDDRRAAACPPRHPVSTVPGTLLAELMGGRIDVDSFHHQAVDRVGRGLVVSARAGDGVIEALEMPGRYVLGMQCELHEEWRLEPRLQRVVEAFVAAASAYPAAA